jgi:hypothetical protein
MKQVFELFIGKHFINEFEDGLFVLLVDLLDQTHLLYCRLLFYNYLSGYPAIVALS